MKHIIATVALLLAALGWAVLTNPPENTVKPVLTHHTECQITQTCAVPPQEDDPEVIDALVLCRAGMPYGSRCDFEVHPNGTWDVVGTLPKVG